jgi:GT2 family glycosyltransferase
MSRHKIDVLIPTFNRPDALAVTLTSLAAQTEKDFRVILSDQTEKLDAFEVGVVQAVLRLLQHHGHEIQLFKHLPRRGMAEQRQFLLDQVRARFALFLDDDVILEPYVLHNMLDAILDEDCGFVGSALVGLSFLKDVRPHQQAIEFWDGPVKPEIVRPGSREWERYHLHSAANLYHVAQKLGLDPRNPMKYHVAWVGGCVLYNAARLRAVGGFRFWKDLPVAHSGEDVLAQIRVMAEYGGCGLIPSGVYHQELPTTIPDRPVDAPLVFGLETSNLATLPGHTERS